MLISYLSCYRVHVVLRVIARIATRSSNNSVVLIFNLVVQVQFPFTIELQIQTGLLFFSKSCTIKHFVFLFIFILALYYLFIFFFWEGINRRKGVDSLTYHILQEESRDMRAAYHLILFYEYRR